MWLFAAAKASLVYLRIYLIKNFWVLAHLAIPFSLLVKYSIKFSLHFSDIRYLNSLNRHNSTRFYPK